eukprot:CAMPEP_0206020926 /NCGR_PEP_ID=MMETSP1464-20131121/31970_1 /ASSEMBLY_ACC=CAM_ASM_001124 /TAXON_ID=119497 /ORGANISM="Exanthemachrysis gayraliae, Strain RCC1523" /LENGTH=118 /DNA_ID=CAMNT_0053394869 /DNA_START=210 /DNA_END=563 /DNA_ORIENTATION=-
MSCKQAGPTAAGAPQTVEQLQVAAGDGSCARLLVPGAFVGPGPLEHVQVATLRGRRARPIVPRASVGSSTAREGRAAWCAATPSVVHPQHGSGGRGEEAWGYGALASWTRCPRIFAMV